MALKGFFCEFSYLITGVISGLSKKVLEFEKIVEKL